MSNQAGTLDESSCWVPPKTRRGTPGSTPLAILRRLLDCPQVEHQRMCWLCLRRKGITRLITSPASLAARLGIERPTWAIVCSRCARSSAVRDLLAPAQNHEPEPDRRHQQ
jgi:hypothetical protein